MNPRSNSGATGSMNSREGLNSNFKVNEQWKQMGDAEKKGVVNSEIKRMKELPGNSTYATHRLRVLNKIMELMSNQLRNPSENEELELLLAGLSL